MIESVKTNLRNLLNLFHLDLTRNLKYDRLTKSIIAKTIGSNSICIDIGAHKGEIMDLFLKYAPQGKHYAFEPIPLLYENLVKKYSGAAEVHPFALSDKEGESCFQFVRNAPAYSGIVKRKYHVKKPDIEEIKVQLKTLDSLISANTKVDFIKIDVEGGEFPVLKGAQNLIFRDKPYIIFESGTGASEFYGTVPEELYDFITLKTDLEISLLTGWLKNQKALTRTQYCACFYTNSEYYFIAHPKRKSIEH
jgi:FkbM family methyltransferase